MDEPRGGRRVFVVGAAVIVAVVFFGLIAAMYGVAASISMELVYAIIALALLGIVYVGTGGRAWFRARERPERIIGARLRFSSVERYPHPSTLPDAAVREWNGREYRAEFIEPLAAGGREVFLSARQAGYPVSRVSMWRGCYVNGRIGQDDQSLRAYAEFGIEPDGSRRRPLRARAAIEFSCPADRRRFTSVL